MTNDHRLRMFGIIILWLIASTQTILAASPNVLFVYTDDQSFDTIHALGNSQIHTPTLDELVGRGFVFTNAYCQGGQSPAVCVPSRVMLLTGIPAGRTKCVNIWPTTTPASPVWSPRPVPRMP